MLYRATVVDNIDPENRGRIKVRRKQDEFVPTEQLPYVEYCSPFGGGNNVKGAGFFFIPEIGSQVWILEEGDDPNFPVWIGSSFYDIQGRQNIPIEASGAGINPEIRIIKTPKGNKLVFDDRDILPTGGLPIPIELKTSSGAGLEIQDGIGNGTGISLGFGNSSGGFKLTRGGLRLVTNRGSGLYVNDQKRFLRLRDKDSTASISIVEKQLILKSESNSTWNTDGELLLQSGKKLSLKGDGGVLLRSIGKTTIGATSNLSLSAGETILLSSSGLQYTGVQGSSIVFDLPVPGVPGTDDGFIALQSNLGAGILLRNGPPNPKTKTTPTPWYDSSQSTSQDATAGATAGRLFIGDAASGNSLLEGRLGGIFISGTPLPYPGTNGTGRVPIPFATITPQQPTTVTQAPLSPSAPPTPIITPGQPQPAVLGGNLYFMLSKLCYNLLNLTSILLQNAPSFSVSPVGPTVLSPIIVQQLTVMQSELLAIISTNLSPAPLPTNILSSVTFVD